MRPSPACLSPRSSSATWSRPASSPARCISSTTRRASRCSATSGHPAWSCASAISAGSSAAIAWHISPPTGRVEPPMKITDIEGVMVRLPAVKPIGDGCQTILIIKVKTDEGLVGIGEAHSNPLVSKAILDAPLCSISSSGLRELLIGQDPRDINRLYDLMYKRSVTYGRRGAVMHVISGIEIALWDILGKATGQPIHRLLGGARKTAFNAYASDLAPDTAKGAVKLAERHAAAGYKAVKLGWGGLGGNPKEDAALVGPVRKAGGPKG